MQKKFRFILILVCICLCASVFSACAISEDNALQAISQPDISLLDSKAFSAKTTINGSIKRYDNTFLVFQESVDIDTALVSKKRVCSLVAKRLTNMPTASQTDYDVNLMYKENGYYFNDNSYYSYYKPTASAAATPIQNGVTMDYEQFLTEIEDKIQNLLQPYSGEYSSSSITGSAKNRTLTLELDQSNFEDYFAYIAKGIYGGWEYELDANNAFESIKSVEISYKFSYSKMVEREITFVGRQRMTGNDDGLILTYKTTFAYKKVSPPLPPGNIFGNQ